MPRWREVAGVAALAVIASCYSPPPPRTTPPPSIPRPAPAPPPVLVPAPERDPAPAAIPVLTGGGVAVRIVLPAAAVSITAPSSWRLTDITGESVLLRAPAGERWTLEQRRGGIRAVSERGQATAVRSAPLMVQSEDGSPISYGDRRYRGQLVIRVVEGALQVVNHLTVEEYLRGVVPLEIGARPLNEIAAIEAQAVAARSYTYARLAALGANGSRTFDMGTTTSDQVYGGVDAERAVTDQAVARTRGLVLMYGGRIVNTVYSSTCGGSTAEAPEIWQSQGEPWLQRVSDRIPGTDRFYCDISPRFSWTRTLDQRTLAAGLERYLRSYAQVSGAIGTVRNVEILARTPSDRVESLAIVTDRSRYVLRGNNVRYVLRAPGDEIVNSTYFSVESRQGGNGLVELILRGGGYGHGVGMCQFGAIGRARAGQDFRTILKTYYPGTVLASVD